MKCHISSRLCTKLDDFFSHLSSTWLSDKVGNKNLRFLLIIPWEFLLVKKFEIEKTKTTFIISVLKVAY
jgi:hypothetical protein